MFFGYYGACLNNHCLFSLAKERNVKVEHFVNISDKNGTKPLHLCARGGLLNIMEVLLRHNADVNAQRILSGRGYSALHLAAAGGDLKMCRMLLNYDAELDIRDYDGCTPLHRYNSVQFIVFVDAVSVTEHLAKKNVEKGKVMMTLLPLQSSCEES